VVSRRWCPHELGDGDDVHPGAEQVGAERVPDDVRGDGGGPVVVDQVGVGGQGVEQLVDGAGRQPPAAPVQEQSLA
jgi:hypothetical protein